MPVLRDRELLSVGDYFVNVRTGVMVEIMGVDLSGNCRVQNARDAVDAAWQELRHSQISSALWRRVHRT